MPEAAGSAQNGWLARAYHAVMADGSVAGVLREMIKDTRNMFMEVFFGKGERGGEPGAPGNPLFHNLVETQKHHASFLQQPVQLVEDHAQAMINDQNPASVTAAILADPQAFLTPQPQNGQDMQQQQGNAMGQDGGPAQGTGQDQSVTATILGNPQSFLTPQQQNGQDMQQQVDHGRDM